MNKENLANGLLASAVSNSATSATLQSGYGGTMPAVPFKLTVTPFGQLSTKGNSEIWLVTARAGEVLTITRGQDGTTAKAFASGDIVANGVYVSDFLGGNSFVQKETPTGTINGTNKVFTTSQAYAPGSLMAYVNGLPQFQFAVETDPTTGSFTFDDAPATGDFVRVSYQPVTAKFGNADTVDNYHANATPTANNLLPLDSDSRYPWATLPAGSQRQLAYVSRENAKLEATYAANEMSMLRNDANTANLAASFTNTETTIYVSVEVVCWGTQGYKNLRLLLDGATPSAMIPSSSPVSYLTDQVTAAAITFRLTGVTPGTHSITAGVFRPNESGVISYRNAAIRVYEVKA